MHWVNDEHYTQFANVQSKQVEVPASKKLPIAHLQLLVNESKTKEGSHVTQMVGLVQVAHIVGQVKQDSLSVDKKNFGLHCKHYVLLH